nr:alkaline phosphatase D family protein [Aliiglaciecola sp. M165]
MADESNNKTSQSTEKSHVHTACSETPIPKIIAGPILRAVNESGITVWIVTSVLSPIKLVLKDTHGACLFEQELNSTQHQSVQVGERAFIQVLHVQPESKLINGDRYFYDVITVDQSGKETSASVSLKDILYEQHSCMSFVFKSEISNLLHGSCRKPHHQSDDGLLAVDDTLKNAFNNPSDQPDMLILSGDQVYIDDVAGPTLCAIHNVIDQLGLFHEDLPLEGLENSAKLTEHEHGYYQRPMLLPDDVASETVMSYFFAAKKKPIFTSVNANNHLISLAEVIAMYILVWSPEMWQTAIMSDKNIADEFKEKFAQEKADIEAFSQGLYRVRRALAHIPVYMIFDDHDVTDDWNLTRGWEDAVYNHPFAKRIVGNAILGYWLCQGWGNDVDKISPLTEKLSSHFTDSGLINHDETIDAILHWDQWHYTLDTAPKIVVLDTRTQRWRSESSLVKPSGLMDWEALCDLQQELINQPSVIMVSAAPIFGVKLIETVQRIFTFFGKALVVDAENWMAHKGTASVILNIFRHYKTPPNFVILSGDVHYSFVYDITLKFRRNSPHITQITSSGIKNEFPDTLIRWFDRLNRILYGPRSPLNWFTQRRNMTIKHRKPGKQKIRTLYNGSAIGLLKVDKNCKNVDASLLRANGETVKFHQRD